MIHKTIRLVEANLPPRQGEKSHIKDYNVILSSLGTVEEVIQGILAQPENKMARGFFHIVEGDRQTGARLFQCQTEGRPAVYQSAQIYGAYPVPTQFLTREVWKVEADGYGLGSYTLAISYYLAIKPKLEYFESRSGQFSLFRQEEEKCY